MSFTLTICQWQSNNTLLFLLPTLVTHSLWFTEASCIGSVHFSQIAFSPCNMLALQYKPLKTPEFFKYMFFYSFWRWCLKTKIVFLLHHLLNFNQLFDAFYIWKDCPNYFNSTGMQWPRNIVLNISGRHPIHQSSAQRSRLTRWMVLCLTAFGGLTSIALIQSDTGSSTSSTRKI